MTIRRHRRVGMLVLPLPNSSSGYGWSLVGFPSTKWTEQTRSYFLDSSFFSSFLVLAINVFDPNTSVVRVFSLCWKWIQNERWSTHTLVGTLKTLMMWTFMLSPCRQAITAIKTAVHSTLHCHQLPTAHNTEGTAFNCITRYHSQKLFSKIVKIFELIITCVNFKVLNMHITSWYTKDVHET